MGEADVRAAASVVVTALREAGRSEGTIRRYEAVLERFAAFLAGRGLTSASDRVCLDFIAGQTGTRLGTMREPAAGRDVNAVRRPAVLMADALAGRAVIIGRPVIEAKDGCPARFRPLRDDYVASCRARGNAEATLAAKDKAASRFLGYLDETGTDLAALGVRDVSGFLLRQRGLRRKTVAGLRSALADFLAFMAAAGRAPQGLAGRMPPHRHLRHEAERIPPEKLRLADIDRPRILRFLVWLEDERGCSPATRNQRLAVIKSFCRYTAVEQPDQLGRVTQVLAIRQKKTPAPQLDHLAGNEVKALLAAPGTASARAVRDTVLLALAYDTAARAQELCDLDVADIRRGTPMTVVIHGKGDKVRYVPVMDPTARLVGDYLDHRGRHPGVGTDADPLFAGPNHSRLTRSGIAKLLARHVKAIRARDPGWAPGLPVTPHTLRRSRAMHLVQAGVNLIYIRDLLGHADVSTTEIYARADAEAKRRAIENAYEPLTPDALPDWTQDSFLVAWLDSLGH